MWFLWYFSLAHMPFNTSEGRDLSPMLQPVTRGRPICCGFSFGELFHHYLQSVAGLNIDIKMNLLQVIWVNH